MNNNQSPRNAISHKELNDFLIKATKDITSVDVYEKIKTKETEDFNELIQNWTVTSKKILHMMNSKDVNLSNNKASKSLMALGAMGAHITMALHALKASECD